VIAPLADARAAGLRVEIADLGDWSPAALVSEYDPRERTIRVNERALARAEASGGAAAREALFAAAVAHELYHHAVGGAEGGADAFVRERYGIDPARAASVLRR